MDREPRAQAESDLALAEVSLVRAESIQTLDLTAADVIDLKAVGLATAAIAALTILVAADNVIGGWWAPALAFVLSAVCFFPRSSTA